MNKTKSPTLEPISTIKPSKRRAKEFELRQPKSQPIEKKKEEFIKLLCSFVAFNAEMEGTQKVIFVGEQRVLIDSLWNWIIKNKIPSPLVSDKLNVKKKK